MRYEIDFGEVETAGQVHEALRKGLKLPEYYGRNMDALWDCLTGGIETPCEICVRGMKESTGEMKALMGRVVEMMEEAAKWHGRHGREMRMRIEE